MREMQNFKELVAVPVRRTPIKTEKAERLGDLLPYDEKLRQPIPRRWHIY